MRELKITALIVGAFIAGLAVAIAISNGPLKDASPTPVRSPGFEAGYRAGQTMAAEDERQRREDAVRAALADTPPPTETPAEAAERIYSEYNAR